MEERERERLRTGDWIEQRLLVLSTLERIANDVTNIYSKLEKIRTDDLWRIKTDIALLKFQAAMWGALGGTVLSVATAFVMKMLLK